MKYFLATRGSGVPALGSVATLMTDNLITAPRGREVIQTLLAWQQKPLLRRFVRELLYLYGVDIPVTVQIGENVRFHHRALGVVIHGSTVIGKNVQIWQHVTVGDAVNGQSFDRVEIGDNCRIYAGAVIAGGAGVTRLGEGTVVAANAVLRSSTGPGEVWGGVPARRLA